MSNMNIPPIVGVLSDEYAEMAVMNFAMEYYNVYEEFCDFTLEYIEGGRSLIGKIVGAAKGLFIENYEYEKAANGLKMMRKTIMDMMEVLTAYTDYFQIHEYLLNRIELKFQGELPEIDNDEESKKILQFIFQTEDNMEVNMRIKEMISQLPVRITSTRFYDLLKDSISIYKGAEKESIESYVYMIKSAAGIHNPTETGYFEDLKKYKDAFAEIDYKNMTEASYREYESLMEEVGTCLSTRTEFCISAIKLVNSLAAYYVCKPYTTGDIYTLKRLEKIITAINAGFDKEFNENGNFESIDIAIADEAFGSIEGKPEKLSMKISSSEGAFEGAREELKAADYDCYIAMDHATKLMSSSDYAKLDDVVDVTPLSANVVDEYYEKLVSDLDAAFEGKDRQVKRAIMASVLKELPVFFLSHTEVMNYVRFSLDNCKDLAEKTAAIRMFWQVYE